MKKVVLFVAVAAFAFSMSSCTKDYTCTCEIAGVSSAVDYNGLNKSEAETAEAACTSSSICKWSEQ